MSLNNWELYCKVSEISNPVEALQDFDLVPRYIRLRTQVEQNNNNLQQQLCFQNFSCAPVSWLPRGSNFYSILEKLDEVENKVSFKDIKSQLLKVTKQVKNNDDQAETVMMLQDENQIVSMDASSFVALLALCPKKSDKVLDICCAPGMKLIAVCDLLAKSEGGVVVGVDASLERALVCRSLLAQHVSSKFSTSANEFGHCRLYLGDGRNFSSVTAENQIQEGLRSESSNPAKTARHQKYQLQKIKNGMKKQSNNSAGNNNNNNNQDDCRQEQDDAEKNVDDRRRQREEDRSDESSMTAMFCLWESETCPALWLNDVDEEENGATTTSERVPSSHFKFDRVLVDAECTHDGSVAHMNKFQQANFGDKSPNLFFAGSSSSSNGHTNDQNEEKMLRDSLEKLYNLQFALLLNGYENCRENGGVLIYSTCSMSPKQNEEIVKKFLAHVGEGKIELVDPFEELSKIGKSGYVTEEYSEKLKFHVEEDEDEKSLTELRRAICIESKILAKTYSLHPSVSKTSVQFIAKFVKINKEK